MLKRKWNYGACLCFFAVLLINTCLLVAFHQRTWAPHEDGYFAHVAERILDGEKLTKDIESRHAGFIHLLNAAVMAITDRSFLSLRYPLIALGIVQSLLIFFLFLPQGLLFAAFASLIITIYGYLQFLTPTTHWYCLFLMILILACLRWILPTHRRRLILIGFCLGLIFLFRQLTGVFLGIGLLTYFLIENNPSDLKRSGWFPRILILIMAAGLIRYFFQINGLSGFILFGVWPLLLLSWVFFKTRISNRQTFSLLISLGAGFLIPWIPMVFYQLAQGSLFQWVDDTFFRASKMLAVMPYQDWSSYLLYMVYGGAQAFKHETPALVWNGIYWVFLPLMGFLNGFFLYQTVRKEKTLLLEQSLPFLAVFYSLVSHTLQMHLFLSYTTGLALLGLILTLKKSFSRLFPIGCGLILFLCAVNLRYQVGQPLQRGVQGIIEGAQNPLAFSSSPALSKLKLKIPPEDILVYEELIGFIKANTNPEDALLVFPGNPEVYFLADRKNPFRFTLLPMVLQNQSDLEIFLKQLETVTPKMILHNRTDKYNTPLTRDLMTLLQKNYKLSKTISDFDVYIQKEP